MRNQFKSSVIFLLLLFIAGQLTATNSVLVIKDELPQMQVLADVLRHQGGYHVTMVDQEQLPADLSAYTAVVLYLHFRLYEKTEQAVMEYANKGGRLVVLHHSISSSKRMNQHWFDFLKIELEAKPLAEGGYAYRDPVKVQLVNLQPKHFITSHNIRWPESVRYNNQDLSGVSLMNTEVYLNHIFTDDRDRTILCGFRYYDEETGQWFVQDRAAWLKKTGSGLVFYFMFGHKNNDFENPVVSQIIVNSIMFH
jgi:hypothetical protein